MSSFPPRNGGFPITDVRIGPLWILAAGRQNRVAALDRLQRVEDRLARARKPVPPHPLDLADPHRHTRKFGRVGRSNSIPLTLAGADRREAALESQRLGLQLDLVLHIVEGMECEVEEVTGAAGRGRAR